MGRDESANTVRRHHVVVVGGGFGGLETVSRLADSPVDITLIDQRNHHIFQPLLYQVATAVLAPSEIAWPIRHLYRKYKNVTVRLGKVTGVAADVKEVLLEDGAKLSYDTLVLATGAQHSYFGRDEWADFAPGLKTLEGATELRGKILKAFEEAEHEADPARRAALLTFVVVGAGPTGVELAGAIADMAHGTLVGEFRQINPKEARVVLIEAASRILPGYVEKLSAYSKQSLEKLGVEVRLGKPVSACTAEGVVLAEEEDIPARNIIWAAGVKASPAAEWMGAESDRAGRVIVEPDLTLAGHPEVFAIGDTVCSIGADGKPVPGIAPAAKQQGRYVANVVRRRLKGETLTRPFKYNHQGSMAQIGHRSAVVDFGRVRLKGAFAWWLWGIVHVYFLIGLPSRLRVAISWLWIHTLKQRSSRLITDR